MSLTLPSADDLEAFWGDEAADIDEDRADLLISLAANLLWLATGIDADPTDSRLAQLVTYGILDMAIYLYITRDDIDANYSPFQSERIGSYTYSKTYIALSKTLAKNNGGETGVPLFDQVVAYLLDELIYGDTTASGEQVFREQYTPFPIEVFFQPLADQDLNYRGPFGWDPS